MTYQAVIFDLIGTLAPNFSRTAHQQLMRHMAGILDGPAQDLDRLWDSTYEQRATGLHGTVRDTILYCCRELGLHPDEGKVEQAVHLRLAFITRGLEPRPGAVETLSRLRSSGYKTAVISNCSSEVPLLWPQLPFAPLFDATIFSCEAGMRKPDPRIYALATSRLEVPPDRCLYVGDGDGGELAGAAAVGMHPVMLCVPDEDQTDAHLVAPEEWSGPRIERLVDVWSISPHFPAPSPASGEGEHSRKNLPQ